MSRKNKKYSSEFRLEILKEFDEGASGAFLSKKYNINRSTISSWSLSRKKAF